MELPNNNVSLFILSNVLQDWNFLNSCETVTVVVLPPAGGVKERAGASVWPGCVR